MAGTPLSIFISYSRTDSVFVDDLEADLKDHGFFVWVDRRKMEGGQNFRNAIQKAIDLCQIMLVVLSPEAMTSKYVRQEYEYADGQGKQVIPLNWKTTTKVFLGLDGIHWIDFQSSYEQGLRDLLNDLSRLQMALPPSTQTGPNPASGNSPPGQTQSPFSGPSARVYPLGFPTPVIKSDPLSGVTNPGDYATTLPKRLPRNNRSTSLSLEWIFAFCLLIGLGTSVGMLSQSWPWAIGIVAVLALLSYPLGYQRDIKLKEGGYIFLISEIFVLGITLVLSSFQYNQTYPGDSSSPLWAYIGLSFTLGIIAGLICGGTISGIISENTSKGDREAAAVAFLLTLVIWLVSTLIFAILMFGRGLGWGVPVLTGCITSFVSMIGLITSGYICVKTITYRP